MRTRARAWPEHLIGPGPVHFEITTPTGPHRISWHSGPLILHDHDIAAERVLRAFGGISSSCPCLLLFDALASRVDWDFDTPMLPTAVNALKHMTADSGYLSLSAEERVNLLMRARHRLVMQAAPPLAAVIDHAHQLHLTRQAEKARPPEHRPPPRDLDEILEGVAVPLLLQAMRAAQPALWKQAPLAAVGWKQSPGDARLLQGWLTQLGGYIAVSLPPAWLNRVWRRGIALVDGSFILSVDQPSPAVQLAGERLGWQAGPDDCLRAVAEPCSIRRVGTRWQVSNRSNQQTE